MALFSLLILVSANIYLVKKGMKYPEAVSNHAKSGTSVMLAGTAGGKRAEFSTNLGLYMGGPVARFYTFSGSVWFDEKCFEDWFRKIALPYLKNRLGMKVFISNNLLSHIFSRCSEKIIVTLNTDYLHSGFQASISSL